MSFGGYAGFEQEAYRQSSLAGRQFSSHDKAMQVRNFHATSIPLAHDAPASRPVTSLPGLGRPGAKPAGEVTRHGIPEVRFDLLNGNSSPQKWRLGPVFTSYASRLPVHTLPGNLVSRVTAGEDVDRRPPDSRRAGVTGPGQRQYVNMGQALKPPGAAQVNNITPAGQEYRSFGTLTLDKLKHVRAAHAPQERAPQPVTSSQAYGWNNSQFHMGTMHNRRLCRETRFQQSLSIGPRHKSGYAGQGTL